MITPDDEKPAHPKMLEQKYPKYKRALSLLESSDERERMKGYALLTIRFSHTPEEIQHYTRNKWSQENGFKTVKKPFIEYCKKTFASNGL